MTTPEGQAGSEAGRDTDAAGKYKSVRRKELLNNTLNVHGNYDDLPLMLSVPDLVALLGISRAGAYELVKRKGFPALHIGRSIVLYDYAPGRGQEYPNAFLKGFHGYLQTDGYSGYHGLEGVTHVGCWAHARRKFDEACRAVPKGKRSPTAEQGVAYCTQLFELEKEFKDLSPEERKKQRPEREKPVLDAMLAWANTRNAAPKSALGKALTYFLIEMAKENGLDPYRYLTWLFAEAPRLSQTDPSWAPKLLPWNAPENCRPAK